MSKIKIAGLYAHTRNDGATLLRGRIFYDGLLKVEPNPDKQPGDNLPDFIATVEMSAPKPSGPYRGPQLLAPQSAQAPRALPQFVEGEVVE